MDRALYAYYGDDFTGSTDVLEVLASAGVRSVLFIGPASMTTGGSYGPQEVAALAAVSRRT